MKICVFGDSIVWGAFDSEQGGWTNRLRNYFEGEDKDVDVYNLGVSGDNTEDLLKRFAVEAVAREPDVIVFAIGTNDSQYIGSKDNPRVPIDVFRENLKKLIGQAQKFTPRVLFVGLGIVDEAKTMPIPWDTKKYYDNENMRAYDAVIQSVCAENDIPVLSMHDVLQVGDLHDGLHPNPQGHQKMFDYIKDFLEIEVVCRR